MVDPRTGGEKVFLLPLLTPTSSHCHSGKYLNPTHHFLFVDVYHQTFLWPEDHAVAQRLAKEAGLSDKQHVAELQRYRCEDQGLKSVYQHVLKVINGDQPHGDVYQQGKSCQRAQVGSEVWYHTPHVAFSDHRPDQFRHTQ